MAVYGIDLGTTYSCITKYEGGEISVILNEFDEKSTASAVYFGPNNNVIVGDDAKCYVQTEGHRVIQFVKREIGKEALPHEIDGKSYNAIEISSLILKKIKKYAEEKGENVKDVVITCPAYFGNEERNATIKAGELAGLNVLDLVNEPTAAAISYAHSVKNLKSEVVVVYDLGGGTFDVTVLDIKVGDNGVPCCTVLATDGNDTLGGKDWDEQLFLIIKNKLMEENGLTDITDEDCNNIRAIVEKTKKSLSNKEVAKVRVIIDGENMTCDITREEFENATAQLVTETTDLLDRILKSDKVSNHKIDKILLVGGSTNMPMISRTLKEKYGEAGAMNKYAGFTDTPYVDPIPVVFSDPETSVAKGAAIVANLLKKSSSGFPDTPMEIHDISSRTFGVSTWDDDGNTYLSNIVFKGEAIPAENTNTYHPLRDNQSGVRFFIYESIITDKETVPFTIDNKTGDIIDVDLAYGVKYLGILYLPFPPNVKSTTEIHVTMGVTAGGIKVTAVNSLNNEKEEVEIKYNNSQVDVNRTDFNALTIE